MSESPEFTDLPASCNQYLVHIAIDLAVCVVGFLGITSGNQSFLILALIIVYAYGSWVFLKSSLAGKIYQSFKGGGPLGGIFMLILFGLVAPVIHLVYSTASYLACPNSFPVRLYSRLLIAVPALDETSSYVRGLFVGVWGWLVVLAIFSICYYLFMLAPGLLNIIMSAVQAAEPDYILGQLIYYLIALPLALVFLVLAFVIDLAWSFIAMALTLITTGFLTISILPLIAGDNWPKTRWIIAGSVITVAMSVLVYLVPVRSLLLSDIVTNDLRLDMFTSLPFLATSSVLAVLSFPFLYYWVRLSSEDIFTDDLN